MANFKDIYSYFSHNFRTSVSTIIATIEAVKLDLIDIHSDEMDSVYESAYMLDLYDTSLSICIKFISDGKVDSEISDIDPTFYVEHLIREFDSYIKESGMPLTVNLVPFKTKSNDFTVKNLLQLITCEILRLSPGGMTVASENNNIIFSPLNTFIEIPEIFGIFQEILKACNVDLEYSIEEVRLSFI